MLGFLVVISSISVPRLKPAFGRATLELFRNDKDLVFFTVGKLEDVSIGSHLKFDISTLKNGKFDVHRISIRHIDHELCS